MQRSVLTLVLAVCALVGANSFAATDVPTGAQAAFNLWPGVAPGSESWTRKETITPFVFAGRTVAVTRNVVTPTLTVFLPPTGKSTGVAAIIAPGGAFRHVTMDSEGYDVARWLAERGIAGLVLKYRVIETPADDAAYKRSMDELTARISDPKAPRLRMRGEEAKHAIEDGVQALKLVREHADEWHIDVKRVGMIGFSAGAAVTSAVMVEPGAPGLAFAAPIYGGPLDPDAALPAKLPPVFLAVAQDDFVRTNALKFNDALQAGKHDSELHVFASGGHGFGLIPQGTTSDHWIDELYWWLQAKAIVPKASAATGAVAQQASATSANPPPAKSPPLGAYAVTVATDPSLPTHTIYRPTDMTSFTGGKLPIVVWGNGGCINAGRAYAGFLTKIASHGYLVVAVGPENVAVPDLSGLKPGQPLPPLPPSMVSKASQLIDGLDWAIAQNKRKGSPYAGKLDPEKVAAMGQSCGGLQAISVSRDPRVRTSVIWNSGVFTGPLPAPPGGPTSAPMMRDPVAKKDDLKAFHAPVAYFIGGPSDIAYRNAEDDFTRIEGVPVFNANLDVGHGGTYRDVNGGWFGEVGVAWLDWRLKGDATAGQMFSGPRCGLCVDPFWTVKKKGMN